MEVKGRLPLPAHSHDVPKYRINKSLTRVQYIIARDVCPRSDIRGITEKDLVGLLLARLFPRYRFGCLEVSVNAAHIGAVEALDLGSPATARGGLLNHLEQRSSVCDPVTRVIAGSPRDIARHITPRLFVEFSECVIVDLRAGPIPSTKVGACRHEIRLQVIVICAKRGVSRLGERRKRRERREREHSRGLHALGQA